LQARADRWLLRLPVVGNIVRKAALARWSRTLATLFAAGVPLVDALVSVRGAAANAVYAEATATIGREVGDGASLAAAIESTGLFPELVGQMVAIGEESGALDQMLAKVADFYEEEVDAIIDGMASIIEPVMIVLLGSFVGLIAASVMGPIASLSKNIGG